MKVKFGAIVVAGRGKIGGHVASRNRFGSYFRTKVTPVNPATIAQQGVRQRFAGLSSAWRGLTQAQRSAWNSSVILFAATDIFGDLRNPSGFNLFQRLNNNLLNIGQTQIDSPPAPVSVDALLTMTIAAAAGAGTLAITYTPAIPADHSFIIKATPAISSGISFVKSQYRQIHVMNAADVTPFSIETQYELVFGDIGPAGMKIFVEAYGVNWASGQTGIPLAAFCDIAV